MDDLDCILSELYEANLKIISHNNNSSKNIDLESKHKENCTELLEDNVTNDFNNGHLLINCAEENDLSLHSGSEYAFSTSNLQNNFKNNQSTKLSDRILTETNMNPNLSEDYSDSAELNSLYIQDTELAAREAGKQLDDLLESLNRFQVQDQRHDSGIAISEVASLNTLQQDETWSENTPNSNSNVNVSNGHFVSRLSRKNAQRVAHSNKDAKNQNEVKSELSNEPDQLLVSMLDNLSNDLSQKGANTASKGICHGCKQNIIGTVINALDHLWHPEHFVCVHCQTKLMDKDFYELDGQTYCTSCHALLFLPKCAFCGEVILEKYIIALSRAWHTDHFFCSECRCSFNGLSIVHKRENGHYCSDCYFAKFGTRCFGCQQPITDRYITALDMPWHETCFRCHDCDKILNGSMFHDINGLPYCDDHYYSRSGFLCVACSNPIKGKCINALGKRYHPEHFICSYCLMAIKSGTFKENSGRPYCHQCFSQLFG